MKTNRIHSIHQKIKRCWFCNKKLIYSIPIKSDPDFITTDCSNCTNNDFNFFFIEINKYNNLEIQISFGENYNEDYFIRIKKHFNKFNIHLLNTSQTSNNYIKNNILFEHNLSLQDFRKINIKDYFKLIKSWHNNKLFL